MVRNDVLKAMLQTKGSNPLFATNCSIIGFFRRFSWKTGLTSVGNKVYHFKLFKTIINRLLKEAFLYCAPYVRKETLPTRRNCKKALMLLNRIHIEDFDQVDLSHNR